MYCFLYNRQVFIKSFFLEQKQYLISRDDKNSYAADNKQGYTYLERKNPWGDSGYFPAAEFKAVTPSNKQIHPNTLKRGWYKSTAKFSGTSGTWLFGESESGFYFLIFEI